MRYRAGCGRETPARPRTADGRPAAEFAYTALAFAECPTCEHRVEPSAAEPFCVWRRADRPHPFAALASFGEGVNADPGADPATEATGEEGR